MSRKPIPMYKPGERVWLGEWENNPREKATVLTADVYDWGISYVCEVDEPSDPDDDKLRELTEDQIEGYVED